MIPTKAAEIRARAAAEAERHGGPRGYSPLPGIPAVRYGDPEFFALERRHVFGRTWLFAALETEIPNPGDLIAIDHLAAPLFVARGFDGKIRGFYNSCRHRGTRLVAEGSSHVKKRIVCPYHAWSYELTGALASVAEPRDFPDLDRSCLGLRSVRCDVWAGMAFVNLDDEAPPLRSTLGPVFDELDDEIGDGAVGTEVHLLRKYSYEIECNWKLGVDANLETYHVNSLHRATVSNVIDQRTTTIELFGGGHSRMFLRSRPEVNAELPVARFPHVGGLSAEGVLTYGLFPNVALVVSPNLLFTTNSWPLAPTRTRYDIYFMGPEPITSETEATWDFVLGFNIGVIEEDVAVLAGMQKSIDAGGLEQMHLGYQERRIYQLHEEIDRRIGADELPDGLAVEIVLGAAP